MVEETKREIIQQGTLTFTAMIYHRESPRDEATCNDLRFVKLLQTQEQPYTRKKISVGENWTPLDYGYLNGLPISMILIRNEEGKNLQTIPTEQEKLDLSLKALELAVEGASEGFRVEVGAELPFVVRDFSLLRIRSLSGISRYSITVIPG